MEENDDMISDSIREVRDNSAKEDSTVVTKADIESLRAGSYQAYDKIYLAWHKPIYTMLRHLTGSQEEAEDITQEVFVNLWEYRGRLDPEKKINTFLYMVAKRAAIDYFRRKRSAGNYLNTLAWEEASRSSSDSLVLEKEIELLKEMALSRMPEYRRNIYKLSHIEGLNNDQIAEKLNITKESVYTQLSIARKQLRELIQFIIILLIT